MTPPSKGTLSLSDIITIAIAEERELQMLIIFSIQMSKRGNKKCGKDEVFKLVEDSLDE